MKVGRVVKYEKPPYRVVVVHGGPGAPGEMAPVAKELSKDFGVIEPFQTKNTVNGQVQELETQIELNADVPVVLLGWSWGAWLSYIVAAKNPMLIKKLILVSSGPFESKYAKRIMPTRFEHLSSEEGEIVKKLLEKLQLGKASDKDLQKFGELMAKADSYDPLQIKEADIKVQSEIYENVWREADKMRKSGKLLKLGKGIKCPVVAIHGDYDPHPTDGVKKPLEKALKNFRFILLKNCGHTPWKEKVARSTFFNILDRELNLINK